MAEMVTFIGPGVTWPILLVDDHPVARFAADELQTYLYRISDRQVPILTEENVSPCLKLLYRQGTSEGFVRQVSAEGIQLVGRSPRGLLCGVYDLLEELGCRWYSPGRLGERIPRSVQLSLPVGIKDEEPALAGRGLILGHDRFLDDLGAWIDWAGKNRFNSLFLHPFPPLRHGGRAERVWRKACQAAAQEVQRRGMSLEYGGHLLSELLPRRFFLTHRRAFRFDGRRRTPDHNLCPNNSEGLQILRKRARRFFARHRQVDVFHVWPDDIPGGGWCLCPACEHLSPSDQALLITNELADVLAEVNPRAIITFLAYHDTQKPPAAVKPRRNVALLFAPRERCYAHALFDEQCPRNVPYAADLERQLTWFRDAGWPEARIFEYYLDSVLFKGMIPPLANVLAADLAGYQRAGRLQVGMIATSYRPWNGLPLNGYLFAHLAWDPGRLAYQLYQDLANGYYGGPQQEFAAYLQELENAFHLLLELDMEEGSGEAHPPLNEQQKRGSLLDRLPKDALDFIGGSLEACRVKLAALVEAEQRLQQAEAYLEAASRPGAGSKPRGAVTRAEILEREGKEFALTALLFKFFRQRQLAVCLAAEKARRREIRKALDEAEATRRRLVAWGEKELRRERAWRQAFRRMLSMWQVHLWKVRHDSLSWNPLGRLIWRWRIARAVRRLR